MWMRTLIVAAAVLTTSFGRSAFAQTASSDNGNTFGVMVGSEEVTGAIRSASLGGFSPGVAVGALGQFPIAPRLAIRADVMFHWIRDDVCGANRFRFCGSSPNMSYVVSGSLAIVARLNSRATRWSPYILGGVGAYSHDFEDGNVKALRPNHLGLQGGVGFEVRPRTSTIFIEARYMGIPPGGVVPLTIGMRF